jgi:hypothetical protein
MPLQKLAFRPGLYREGTSYSNEGGWYDGDKVRFRGGLPEKIGGWGQVSSSQYNGVARSLWAWADADAGAGNIYIGIGTNTKYYIFSGGTYNDVTPIYKTVTLGTTAISSTAGSPAIITITDPSYSPSVGDYVLFTNSVTVGGVAISGEHIVTSVIGTTQYTINNTATGTTSTGGTGTVIQYEYPTGAVYYTIGTGWGEGPWGGVANSANFALGINPLSIAPNSNLINVYQPNHGFSASGAYISISGATTMQTVPNTYTFSSGTFTVPASPRGITFDSIVGASVPAYYINSTFQITYVDANNYTINMPNESAGSFASGSGYVISSVGTTNWTAIGASSSSVGTFFTATAAGTGTGTAYLTLPNTASTLYGGGSAIVVQEQSGTRGWGTAYTGGGGIGAQIRLWSNDNFGADLVIAPRGGQIFYWQDSTGTAVRAQSLSALANTIPSTTTSLTFASGSTTAIASSPAGIYPYSYITGTGIAAGTYVASNYVIGSTSVPLSIPSTAASSGNYNISYAGTYVPNQTYQVITSAIQEFVVAFGSNSYNGGSISNDPFNPLLVRWSDQANAYQWIPQVTNQSGEFALSNGSYIVGARATRQEILIWTNTALYTMQYVGYPYVWSFQILMDNISIMSPNAMITINNVTYWMGASKFYYYDGVVHTLPCALRQYIFDDINVNQSYQVFAGANEGFNEVWWFYVSNESASSSVDKYVIYNYVDKCWSYGTMARTAWIDNNIISNGSYPVAADYNGRLLYHEFGTDDNSTSTTQPIYAYIQSSDFGIMASDQNNSGQHFGFVWRLLPDVNFNGSTTGNPQVTMALYPRQNSGTAYGTTDQNGVVSSQTYAYPTPSEYTVQQFTGEVYTRLRGRQMSFKCYSNTIGSAWQLGVTRYDVKQDGRR